MDIEIEAFQKTHTNAALRGSETAQEILKTPRPQSSVHNCGGEGEKRRHVFL